MYTILEHLNIIKGSQTGISAIQTFPKKKLVTEHVYSIAYAVQAVFECLNLTSTVIEYCIHTHTVYISDRPKKPASTLLVYVLPSLAKKSFLDIGEECPNVISTGSTVAS